MDVRGVVFRMAAEDRGLPLANCCLSGFDLGRAGGGGMFDVGVDPTTEPSDNADTSNGCCGRTELLRTPGLGLFGGGKCFNIDPGISTVVERFHYN